MNDPQMRVLLQPYLEALHPNELIVHEYGGLGEAIPDIAVFGQESFHAYEIKSDADSLRRLENQVWVYSRLFHRVTVVVGSKYRHAVEALLPEWIGIILLSEHCTTIVRPCAENPAFPFAGWALWMEEAKDLCRKEQIKGYSKMRSYTMPAFLATHLPPELVHGYTVTCLRARYQHR